MITAIITSKLVSKDIAYAINVTNNGEQIEFVTPYGDCTAFYPNTVVLQPGQTEVMYAISSANDTLIFDGTENTASLFVAPQIEHNENHDELFHIKLHLENTTQKPPTNGRNHFLLKQRQHFDDGVRTTWLLSKVSIQEISNNITPITGQTPVMSVDTKEYSGTVTWAPADATFLPGVIYTATIILTAKHGYTFDKVAANFFTVASATTSNDANSGDVTAVFPVTLTDVSHFTYTTTETSATITSYNEVTGGQSVYIPLYIEGKPVEHIASNAFIGITQAKLPRTLKTIADSAFANTSLSEINIPSSVTNIGANAFANCTFSSIAIGNNIVIDPTSFGTTATDFYTRYYWNNQEAAIYVFDTQDYPNIWIKQEPGKNQFFKFSTDTDTILDYDIAGGLDVVIPNHIKNKPVQYIAANAFKDKGINTVKFPVTLVGIENNAFENNNLSAVILSGAIVNIGSSAFASNNLSSIFLPKSINHIGNDAFAASNITNITIGTNVVIGNGASLGNNGAVFKAKYDWNGKRSGVYSYDTPGFETDWEENGVGESQFFQFNIDSRTITDYCGTATELDIPAYIYGFTPKLIANNAFHTKGLTKVICPDTITSIADNAFAGNSLTEVVIGHNVTVAASAFDNGFATAYNERLSGRYVFSAETWIRYTQDKYFTFSAGNITGYDVTGGLKLSIPSTINNVPVTTIKANAFSPGNNGLGLQSLAIAEGITTIERDVFRKNPLLTSINVPSSVTSIGTAAFYEVAITEVSLGANVTIGDNNTLGVYGAKFKERYDTYTGKIAGTYIYDTQNYPGGAWINTALGTGSFFAFNPANGSITNYDTTLGTDVVIPSSINNIDVTTIKESAFSTRIPKLTSVTLSDKITTIERAAFINNQITQIDFKSSIQNIGESAFNGNNLTNVVFPDSLTTLGPHVFYNNPNLTSVRMPANTSVNWMLYSGQGVFGTATPNFQFRYDSCTGKAAGVYVYNTTDYAAPTWVNTGIGDEQFFAFNDATQAITGFDATFGTDVVIPSSINNIDVTTIKEYAFSTKTPKLTSVTLSDKITTIERAAFLNNQITQIDFKSSIQNIGESAFNGNNLTNVVFPDSLTTLGPHVFYNNPNLTSVRMPANTSVNWMLYSGQGVFGTATPNFQFRYDSCTGKAAGVYVYNTTDYAAPTWVNTDIGDEQFFAFNEATQAITGFDATFGTDIDIPGVINNINVTTIWENAFLDKGLTSVAIPEGITTIKYNAFHTNNLASVILPSTLTTTGTDVFYANPLTSVTFQSSNVSIGNYNTFGSEHGGKLQTKYNTFTNKASGTYLYNTPEYPNAWYHTTLGDEQFFAFNEATQAITGFDATFGTDIDIPGVINNINVTTIWENVFLDKGLTSVAIPEGITTIKYDAFRTNNLTSIVLPTTLETTGTGVFYANPLTDITIGADVTIGDHNTFGANGESFKTYYDVEKLAGHYIYADGAWAIELPPPNYFTYSTINGGTAISIDGYDHINGGLDVIVPSSIDSLPVHQINNNAFFGKGLTSITLPEGLLSIRQNALTQNNFSTLVIPNSVTNIATEVARGSSIVNLTLGTGITAINDRAFENNLIENLTINGNVTSIGLFAFYNNKLATLTNLPSTLLTIGTEAFEKNPLTNVIIPDSVTTMNQEAFYRHHLSSLTLGTGLTTLKYRSFWTDQANSLTSVVIPTNITTIEAGVFTGCPITHIEISADVTMASDSMGDYGAAFYTLYSADPQAGIYEYSDGTWAKLPNFTPISAFTFNTSTKTITGYDEVLGGDNVYIPEQISDIDVEVIGWAAFSYKNLTKIYLPTTLKTIESEAFKGNAINDITIGDNVSVVYTGDMGTLGYGFMSRYNTYTNKSAGHYIISEGKWIKEGIELVENFWAFNDATKTITNYDFVAGYNVVMPNQIRGLDVEHITGAIFAYRHNLTVVFPSNLKTIGNSLFSTGDLTTINIPLTVTSIGTSAFASNPITNVTIGANVSLGNSECLGTYGASLVTLYTNTPLAGTYSYSGGNWTKTA